MADVTEQRRPRVVIAGGGGTLGAPLAAALASQCQVLSLVTHAPASEPSPTTETTATAGTWRCDLTSIPDTEVALAGCEVLVFLARTSRSPARLLQGSPEDLDLLMADSVARAAPRTSCARIVFFGCGANDPREAVLRSSGVPVAVLEGGGADPVSALAELVLAADAQTRQLPAWSSPEQPPRAARTDAQVCSVQRFARPAGVSARSLALAYFEWLGRTMPLVRVHKVEQTWLVSTAGVTVLVLRESAGRSEEHSCWLDVIGGALAAKPSTSGQGGGRFEFRVLANGAEVVTLLSGFAPALPWPVYRATQAIAHRRTMRSFAKALQSGALVAGSKAAA